MSAYANNSASDNLIHGARDGNVDAVMDSLSAGADKEARCPGWNDYTALHWSVENGDINVVLKLIKADVNVDSRTGSGDSALHLCYNKPKDIALILMGAGAIIDAKNNTCATPLMVASVNVNDDLVSCLLEVGGAEVGHIDDMGQTAMHHACAGGYSSVVNILAQHGADIRTKDCDGEQPIHCAAEAKNDLIVSTLIQLGADVNCTDNHGMTPLFVASYSGSVDVVETLLRNGAHTNITTQGMQATHTAIIYGHFNVLKKLIEYGSDINATMKDNQNTLLHLAVQNNHKDIAEWLILKGSDPYTCNTEGHSAIQLALNEGKRELVSFMASRNLHLPSAEATSLQCAVCLDQRTTTVMALPCRHAMTCQNCTDRMEANNDDQCPICREEITQRIPIFLD